MRFLSDDGKVFNTADECKEYEDSKKKNDEREELKKKYLRELKDEYTKLLHNINEWLDSYNNYLDKYPEAKTNDKKSEFYFDLDDLFNFLTESFGGFDYEQSKN